jgi:Transposase zinc-binding domain
MSRPPLEVAELVSAAGDAFIERSRKWITWKHVKVLLAIARCRTAALGGHLDQCTRCGHRAISYNSCRNRHCPKCQAGARDRWLAARRQELLPTPYVHVVFTLPRHLAPLVLQNKKVLYDLLFRTRCGNTSRSRSRSPTSRCRNRLLQRAAYLESEAWAPSPCPLRHSRRRPVARSHPLGSLTKKLLSSQGGAA